MANPNSLFTELTVATLKNRKKDIADNMSQHNALWRRIKEKNGIRSVNGGTTIVENLDYAENQTFTRYSGYDLLNISPSTVFTASEYLWVQAAVNVTYSGREERVNMGDKTRVFDLVKNRTNNAIATAANVMNRDMYSAGTLANQLGGLQLIVADTNTNTVGGIDGGSFAFWRNKTWSAATSEGSAVTLSSANILQYMNKMWMRLIRGTDNPDFILMSPTWYQYYEASQQQLQRYMKSTDAVAGFETLKYKTADVFFDQTTNEFGDTVMPDSHAYFINTKYIKMCQHPDAQWTPAEDKVSVNQDATIIPLLWMGQMTCSNRFLQGVMTA